MGKTIGILSLFTMLFFLACSKENIEENASLRLEKTLKEYKEILESEPNGWILTYSFGVESPSGEYTYLISFKDGQATVSSDNTFFDYYSQKKVEYSDKITSLYKLMVGEGIVLSFDSYNSIMHRFAIPSKNMPNGYFADYEFVLTSVTKEKITLKGKKYGKIVEMIPNKISVDWVQYLKKKADIDQKLNATFYYLVIDGEEIELKNSTRIFKVNDQENHAINFEAPYRITSNGIQLLQPLNVAGHTLQNFIFEDASTENIFQLKCTDSEISDIYIKFVIIPINQHLGLSRWLIEESYLSDLLKIKWKIAKDGMQANNLSLDFAYLGPSHLAAYPGNTITFSISDGIYAGYILNFVYDNNGKIISFTFKSNGIMGGAPIFQEHLKPFMTYICNNSPYYISQTDDEIKPREMLLVSQNNTNVWLYIKN